MANKFMANSLKLKANKLLTLKQTNMKTEITEEEILAFLRKNERL